MTKEVQLTITGLQAAPGEEEDAVELVTTGEYYFRNRKHFLIYDEPVEGYEKPNHNMVKFAPGYLELTKKGVTESHMIFEIGKKHITPYHTPFGSLLLGLDAKRVDIMESDDYICVNAAYALDVNEEFLADCDICIKIKAL